MKISLFCDEIIKLGLWDSYVYYVVKSEKEAEKMLKENVEIEISETDGLVMGLLKVIETTNLIHKFNVYIVEYLTNKSIKSDDSLLVRKRTFDQAIDKFLDKFPDYWEPNTAWIKSLKELVEYINDYKSKLEDLEVFEIEDKNVVYEFYNTNAVKKLLKFKFN